MAEKNGDGLVALYELTGKDDRRFSPFCWRARLALAHKGIAAAYIPVRFTDKATLAFSQQERVPVLVDRGRIVADSWKIACHLEETYPDRPSLFGGATGRSLTEFIDLWATRTAFPPLVRLVLCDVLEHLDPEDAAYIRASREKQLGTSWEQMRAERDAHLAPFGEALAPLRALLKRSPFLCGETPAYADYVAFSLFQWARMISPYPLLAPGDAIDPWRERMLGLFGGLAGRAPAHADPAR